MRLSWRWALGVSCAVAVSTACTTGNTTPMRDAGPRTDAVASMDAGRDAGRRCALDSECDDGIACTLDACVVGNVCEHMPIDARCSEGERCFVGSGCRASVPEACETNEQCDDGDFCNGAEQCVGPAGSRTCVAGMPADCDDGNACTVDVCDGSPEVNGCRYMLAPGCDGGSTGFDAGMPCEPFEPADYVGTFTFRPAAVSACMSSATYNISEIQISVSGGTLSVRADRFTLTQSPAPTDGTFDARYDDACGSYRLQGTFACANQWSGTWTATFGGTCAGLCSNQSMSVRGSRR